MCVNMNYERKKFQEKGSGIGKGERGRGLAKIGAAIKREKQKEKTTPPREEQVREREERDGLTKHFMRSLKHTNVSQTKYIIPNSQ